MAGTTGKMVWHETGKKYYETGVSNGALYVMKNGNYQAGVPWNGLISVSESPSGAEATAIYADNQKYLSLVSAEEFGATIEAYTYPEEFEACDGSAEIAKGVSVGQQTRATFGLAYKTLIGNETNGTDAGYKLHIIYGATAAPTEKGYSTVNDSPEAITFSWELTTTPVQVEGFKPTANIVIDSRKINPEALKLIEIMLYGDVSSAPTLPTPAELIAMVKSVESSS